MATMPRDRGAEAAPAAPDRKLLARIRPMTEAPPCWGYRRVGAWLRDWEGHGENKKRVYRLRRTAGVTIKQRRNAGPAVEAEGLTPPAGWGIDMRQCLIPALGWASLVVVLDWDTKKVVGWDLSVNDSQPPATGCMAAMNVLGIEPVFTSSDTPKGNADTERLRRTSKEELLWLQEFTRLEEARDVLSQWMAADYTQRSVHSSLGDKSPLEVEAALRRQEATPAAA